MIAHVFVDLDVPHLDHAFEYLIPGDLSEKVQVGSRVQVRFAGRRKTGWVTAVSPESSSGKKLLPVLRVIGPFPLVTEGVMRSAQYLASRYATNLKQILTFAVPTRAAHVEKEFADQEVQFEEDEEQPARSVATLFPRQMQEALVGTVKGLGERPFAAIVVPTAAATKMVAQWLKEAFPSLKIAQSSTEDTTAHRYRIHLQALCGQVNVVVGTRSAAWTPLPRGGSIIVWNSGDPRLREVRSPHLDALDIAVARSHTEGISLLSSAYARSLKDQVLLDSGWAKDTSPPRNENVGRIPRLQVFDWVEAERQGASGVGLLPSAAYDVIRKGLDAGPVLVQVPGPGYRSERTCPTCERRRDDRADCDDAFHLEPVRYLVGSDRLAEELQKAFKDVKVRVSSSTAGVLQEVSASPQIVVATASAEPQCRAGYGAVVIAGAHGLAYRDFLDAALEAERRWMDALALAGPRAPAMLIGTPPEVLEQSLVRWDSALLAKSELAVRAELGFPPAAWTVSVEGSEQSLHGCLSAVHAAGLQVQARPFKVERELFRVVLRVQPSQASQLMKALRAFQVRLSSEGAPLLIIDVNPTDLAAG